MLPPAPGRLSTMMLWPIAVVIFSASMRAIRSPALPGGKGTTKRIGFAGYGCAAASKEASERKNESARRFMRASLNRTLKGAVIHAHSHGRAADEPAATPCIRD